MATDFSAGRTWVLRHAKHGTLTIHLVVNAEMQTVLTVVLAAPNAPERRDEKKLTDYGGALRYVEKTILEREVRGFKLISDSERERVAAERAAAAAVAAAEAASRPPVDPRHARVLTDGAVTRAGWLTLIADVRTAPAVFDELLTPAIDTLQLLCDGDDDEPDDDDDNKDSGTRPAVLTLRRIAAEKRPALRALVLDTHWQTITRQLDDEYGHHWGDLGVLSTLTSLESSYVAGVFSLKTALRLPSLRALSLVTNTPSHVLMALPKSALPALTSLGVGVSGEGEPDDDAHDALTTLLRNGKALPTLTELDVDGLGDPVAILEAAAKRKLRVVRIAGAIDDEDDALPRLLKLAPLYADSEVRIALDTFSDEAMQTLQQAWPGLVDDDNRGLFLPGRYSA